MNKNKNIIAASIGVVMLTTMISLSAFTKPNTAKGDVSTQVDSLSPAAQNVYAPKIPKEVNFAGEALPMDNFDAKERFDRELIANCFRHSSTFLFIKKANRYFPIIEPILAEYGIPDDVKYLAVAESALSNAISSAGAKGFWQFMPTSAATKGLEVSSEVDERYHLEKATVAACQYLKDAHKAFGSWTLAAASYNMGVAGLKENIKKQGGHAYFDLHLNSETSRYILRIMAIKEIMSHPELYGFHISKETLYAALPEHKELTVDGSIPDLATYAQKHKTSYRMLKLYNPWLRSSALTNKGKKSYKIKIPLS
jgi:membrane-bound lytic murein transglycosylase D